MLYVPDREIGAGATARAMLIAAAAEAWGVEPASLKTRDGAVHEPGSGRSARYGELAAVAARQPVPADVTLKDPAAFRLVGRDQKRRDTEIKVTGRAGFGLDARPEGLRFAVVARPPVFGLHSSISPSPGFRTTRIHNSQLDGGWAGGVSYYNGDDMQTTHLGNPVSEGDIGSAPGHIGRHSDLSLFPCGGNNFSLFSILPGIQYPVCDSRLSQFMTQQLGVCNRPGAE